MEDDSWEAILEARLMTSSPAGSFNTRRLERLLQSETNPARRVLLAQLLGEQLARLAPQPAPCSVKAGYARVAA